MRGAGSVDIALVTEGAYPFVHGGVTTWCDQLIRGLPDVRFAVAAVAGTGREMPVVDLPDNVVDLRSVPLWAPPERRRRRPRGRLAEAIGALHGRLVDSLCGEATVETVDEFLVVLRRLHRLSQRVDVAHEFRSDAAVRRVHAALTRPDATRRPMSVERRHPLSDALQANDLIEHFMRALWAPPVEATLTHCVCDGIPVLQGLAAKWAYGTPFVLTEHGVYLRERYLAQDSHAYPFPVKDLVLRFMRMLVLAGYREAALITPVCEFNQRWQVELGADPDVIQPVYNGIDPERFPAAVDEPDRPTIAWVGRIDPLKDVETLIRAFAHVHEALPEARLRMYGPVPVGNESYADACVALVRDLRLQDVATFEGRTSDVSGAYMSGHIVVLSSLSEAFPYTVIEAMASARATVSTDVGGVREAVGGGGLVVPPRDPHAMGAACIELLTNGPRRHALALAARERALAEFTLDGFLLTYRRIYGTYVGSPSPDRPHAHRTVRQATQVAA